MVEIDQNLQLKRAERAQMITLAREEGYLIPVEDEELPIIPTINCNRLLEINPEYYIRLVGCIAHWYSFLEGLRIGDPANIGINHHPMRTVYAKFIKRLNAKSHDNLGTRWDEYETANNRLKYNNLYGLIFAGDGFALVLNLKVCADYSNKIRSLLSDGSDRSSAYKNIQSLDKKMEIAATARDLTHDIFMYIHDFLDQK